MIRKKTRMLPPAACDEKLANELEIVAAQLGKSKGEIIRRAVRFYLRKQHQKMQIKSAKNG